MNSTDTMTPLISSWGMCVCGVGGVVGGGGEETMGKVKVKGEKL